MGWARFPRKDIVTQNHQLTWGIDGNTDCVVKIQASPPCNHLHSEISIHTTNKDGPWSVPRRFFPRQAAKLPHHGRRFAGSAGRCGRPGLLGRRLWLRRGRLRCVVFAREPPMILNSNKCIASSKKCITTSNKKLLLVTSACIKSPLAWSSEFTTSVYLYVY